MFRTTTNTITLTFATAPATNAYVCVVSNGASGGTTLNSTDITDSTSVGRSVLTAADATAARTAISAISASSTDTLTNKTLTNPKINGIYDSTNGLLSMYFSTAAGAVNYLQANGNTTGNGPQLSVQGSDTNIDLLLVTKGSGVAKVNNDTIITASSLTSSIANKADIDLIAGNPLLIANTGTGNGAAINTHPESDDYYHLPHMVNDIANNNYRGGSVVWKKNGSGITPNNTDNLFTPDVEYVDGFSLSSPSTDVVTAEITLYRSFNYTTKWGIVMTSWCTAKDVTIEVYDSVAASWATAYTTTNDTSGFHWVNYAATSGHAMTKVRYTLSNFTSSDVRITQAYTVGYNSALLSGTFLPRGGGAMYGTLDMNSSRIQNLLDPSSNQDAATKTYVDTKARQSTGMLPPVQHHANGGETYTISSGSVTQINGTTIQGQSVSIGDRILVMGAPASSGVGSIYNLTTQPANGVYIVTGNTTNLTVTRATDMSGSVHPAGLSVYSTNATAGWLGQAMFSVALPGTAASFTYGTDSIKWRVSGGASLLPNTVYIGNTSHGLGWWNGAYSTYINPQSTTADQDLSLPKQTSDTLLGATNLPAVNGNSSQQSQVVVSGTNYYITGSNLTANPATPITGMVVGTRFVWRVAMTKTAAGTGTFQIAIYRGTNGSTSDTQDVLQTIGTQTAVVDNMTVDVEVVVTATGATGSYYWSIIPQNKAVTATGFGVTTGTGAFFSGTVSSVAMNTASLQFGLGFKATTGTPTIAIPFVKANAYKLV